MQSKLTQSMFEPISSHGCEIVGTIWTGRAWLNAEIKAHHCMHCQEKKAPEHPCMLVAKVGRVKEEEVEV